MTPAVTPTMALTAAPAMAPTAAPASAPVVRRPRKLKAAGGFRHAMRLALRRGGSLPRSVLGPLPLLLLAVLLAGCDRPETETDPAAVELTHLDSVAAPDGPVEVFQVVAAREPIAWADVEVRVDGTPRDAQRRDADGDGRVSAGDEVRLTMEPGPRPHVVALASSGRVLGALEFRTGAADADAGP